MAVMTNVFLVVAVLGFVLCLVGLTDIVMNERRSGGESRTLLAGAVVCLVLMLTPDLVPSVVAWLAGLPAPAPAGPPPVWLFWLAGALFAVGNAAVMAASRMRRGRPHPPFCTCVECYRAAVERGDVAAMMEHYRVSSENADGAAVVRAANAIREEYLQVGEQWYRKVPRPDGWIGVVRVDEPD